MESSRRIEDLRPDVQKKLIQVIAACKAQGVDLLVTSTFRSLKDQARLYRKTRTRWEIEQKIESLKYDYEHGLRLDGRGFYFLADVLEGVGPQSGPLGKHVTGAGPGQSWHNYGLAFDAYVLVDGKPDFEVTNPAAWEIYIQAVEKNGLASAARWIHNRELPHAQLAGLPSDPLKGRTPDEVRAELEKAGAM
jgi:peptidoglycan L-alanyl-D-glutamate endopeptidase CwlK